jgi:hypothetical protein
MKFQVPAKKSYMVRGPATVLSRGGLVKLITVESFCKMIQDPVVQFALRELRESRRFRGPKGIELDPPAVPDAPLQQAAHRRWPSGLPSGHHGMIELD